VVSTQSTTRYDEGVFFFFFFFLQKKNFIITFCFEQKIKKARERASQTGRNDKWVKQNATLHPL
jgi:hypothetical protein